MASIPSAPCVGSWTSLFAKSGSALYPMPPSLELLMKVHLEVFSQRIHQVYVCHLGQLLATMADYQLTTASLCKKLTDGQDTQFRRNTRLICMGRVAGLLDHCIMVHPPDLEQDYTFIVVLDT
ncbi:hypothetical protein B0T10DRAFT_467357 [Thelonectria olida]|uniref:Uncharacterized protein n=1 Tax=Thelonectria olida TaxID=1576542 RepID=A0A9P8VS10_9HYPO|nr:hypothetical protein B0T10DRAFT_467357 [Thelonectria olida]